MRILHYSSVTIGCAAMSFSLIEMSVFYRRLALPFGYWRGVNIGVSYQRRDAKTPEA